MYRLPLILGITLVTICSLLGIINGLILIAFSSLIITLINLPIRVQWRIYLILGISVTLAFIHVGSKAEWTKAVIPIIGAIFMFRIILYLYEMQYEKQPTSIWKRITYFLLLPNLIFPIFPVIDYKTFKNSYYSKPCPEIYQKGINWMFLGIIHLMTYRIIYYYFLPSPNDLNNIYDLIQYMTTNYALIIRLSGLFHFSVGVICLFGFDLPKTFDNYFLASSFTDLWRRINIYWKDFLVKVFYYPLYFKLKKIDTNSRVILAVLITFVINWFFHNYQWFWIRGSFPLKATDIIFWGLFGVLVAIDAVIQQNSKRIKSNPNIFNWNHALIHTLKVIGMLIFMSVLWSFWTSNTVNDWLNLLSTANNTSIKEIIVISSGILAIVGLGVLWQYFNFKLKRNSLIFSLNRNQNLALTISSLLIITITGFPFAYTLIERAININTQPIRYAELNKQDRELLHQGYYENIIVGNNFSTQIWELERQKPKDWGWGHSNVKAIKKKPNNIILLELKPNQNVFFKGARLKTNSFGLRDDEYNLDKPAKTLRIGILGGSIEMGAGVENDQIYENVLEKNLNNNPLFNNFEKIESLNFAFSDYHLPQNVGVTHQKVEKYDLDILIYTAHSLEDDRSLLRLYKVFSNNKVINYEFINELMEKANVNKPITEEEFIKKLTPYKRDFVQWGLAEISQFCQNNEIIPVFVYVPDLKEETPQNEPIELINIAKKQGFITFNIHDVFDQFNKEELTIAPWDYHPNAKGHQLIAQRLFEEFRKSNELKKAVSQIDILPH